MSKQNDINIIMNFIKGIEPKQHEFRTFMIDDNGNVVCTQRHVSKGSCLTHDICFQIVRTREEVERFDALSDFELEKIASKVKVIDITKPRGSNLVNIDEELV